MRIQKSFHNPTSIKEAQDIQNQLRSKLSIQGNLNDLNLKIIAGVDVGYDKTLNLAKASIVLISYPELKMIESVQAFTPVTFPYVPGYLSFREIPAIFAATHKLSCMPDLFMVDGQGIAHPRRMGIASHLGVLLDIPTVGVAKSCLVGKFIMPGLSKGDISELIYRGECVGTVLRSKEKTKPLFVSPGHKLSMSEALDLCINCLTKYRLPEPTRLADKFSKMSSSFSQNF